MDPTIDGMVRQALEDVPDGLLIGGRWRAAGGGGELTVEDPATRRAIAVVADATASDAVAALDAAVAAQVAWASTPARERGEILRRAFELTIGRADELALLLTLEMGRPIAESRGEVAYGAEFLRWFAEEAVRIAGRYAEAPDGGVRMVTMKQPVGPCLLITPWNFPLAMATRKVGPAVAAGCTMILKPAAQTPLTTLAFARIMEEAGLPPGVLNVLATSRTRDLVPLLLADGRLRKVSFTGSTEVGRELVRGSADQLLRTSMELGGNAPFLVFEDADLDAAVEGALLAKLRNMGESCTAANRFYVAAPVAAEFASLLAERMNTLRVGHGLDPAVQVGPLIDAHQQRHVAQLVDDARRRGATVVGTPTQPSTAGYFHAPMVLADVPRDARVCHEEIFGPVAPIVSFSGEDEALRLANDTGYGLVAFLFTRDLDRALRCAEHLETGMVGINRGMVSNPAAPFGGVKHSGFGREGGPEGIDEYLSLKYLAIDAPTPVAG
ncbi:MAG: NAD-dependent succinate-semialdehyde dehydrogenase [Solirubrobacteraceae bacterium]